MISRWRSQTLLKAGGGINERLQSDGGGSLRDYHLRGVGFPCHMTKKWVPEYKVIIISCAVEENSILQSNYLLQH